MKLKDNGETNLHLAEKVFMVLFGFWNLPKECSKTYYIPVTRFTITCKEIFKFLNAIKVKF